MKLNRNTKILIVGLGVIGGSYAAALRRQGYDVTAITKEVHAEYGKEEKR
jgi:prephenate dehydrogenase